MSSPSPTPSEPSQRRSTIRGMGTPSKPPPTEQPPSDYRRALERECLASIGSESAVLVLAVSPEELKRFTLDHVSGFLLSTMDGATDIETILDISGLPRLLALRHVRSLLQRGIIVIASGGAPR